MAYHTLEKSTEYLCPRIINVEKKHVYYGGDQAWFPRNTAYKGGCGPVCAANILTVYADKNPELQKKLNITIDDKHFISQDDYLMLLEKIYKSMHILEVPILNNIYDSAARSNFIFKHIPCTFGTGITNFTHSVLRYAAKQDIFLQYRSMTNLYCNYTRGLTFIKLALANGYPVILFTTNSPVKFTLYERPYFQSGSSKKIFRHFVTITKIQELTNGQDHELYVTTWGKTGVISYNELYKTWQKIPAFGSTLLYFIPSKTPKASKRAILRSFTILFKR